MCARRYYYFAQQTLKRRVWWKKYLTMGQLLQFSSVFCVVRPSLPPTPAAAALELSLDAEERPPRAPSDLALRLEGAAGLSLRGWLVGRRAGDRRLCTQVRSH